MRYAAVGLGPGATKEHGLQRFVTKGLLKNKFRFCWRLFGCLARRERRAYPSGVCKERATTPDSQTAPALRGGRRLAICFVARRSQPTGGDAPSSRLASGQAALPPKSEGT